MPAARTGSERAKTAIGQGAAARHAPRWLLFVHQLPSRPSNLRVKTWRRMQQLGAIAVKQAVYVLPDSAAAREDFEWLKTEIEGAGGEASVFAAASIDAWSDDTLVEEFRRSRQDAYGTLAEELEQIIERLDAPRRRRKRAAPSVRLLQTLRERFVAIERVDFFGSAGRDRVVTLLSAFEERIARRAERPAVMRSSGHADGATYRGRLWVTRPRPGVDRMSSAWLIRRFIDPDARFDFAADRDAVPERAIPFDMFGVEFSHQGEGCTFETLCTVFAVQHPAVARLSAIVHDLDLKDGKFGAPEAATVGTVIEGLQLTHANDDTLLSQGMALFESLYRAFEHSARSAGPRVLAKPRRDKTRPSQRPRGRRRSP